MTDPTPAEELEAAAAEEKNYRELRRRLLAFSLISYLVFAVISLIFLDFYALVGLTWSALVTIINFLWLEGGIVKVLRPSPGLEPWKLGLRSVARYGIFIVAVSFCFIVAHFDAISVLLGFSVVVAGIMIEAVYSGVKSISNS